MKSVRKTETNTAWFHLYMESINKTNEQIQLNRNKVIDTENRWLPEGKGLGKTEIGEGDYRVQTYYKVNEPQVWNVQCMNIGIIIQYLCLITGDNETYHGDHFEKYTDIK